MTSISATIKIRLIFTAFMLSSGHFLHSFLASREYPLSQAWHILPIYPYSHKPVLTRLGGLGDPRHALGFGHPKKLSLWSLDLQYPDFGAITAPPYHSPSLGHVVQVSSFGSKLYVPSGQWIHSLLVVLSPTCHSLMFAMKTTTSEYVILSLAITDKDTSTFEEVTASSISMPGYAETVKLLRVYIPALATLFVVPENFTSTSFSPATRVSSLLLSIVNRFP